MMITSLVQILLDIAVVDCFAAAAIIFVMRLKSLIKKYQIVRDAMIEEEPPIDWADRIELDVEAMEEAWYLVE